MVGSGVQLFGIVVIDTLLAQERVQLWSGLIRPCVDYAYLFDLKLKK